MLAESWEEAERCKLRCGKGALSKLHAAPFGARSTQNGVGSCARCWSVAGEQGSDAVHVKA